MIKVIYKPSLEVKKYFDGQIELRVLSIDEKYELAELAESSKEGSKVKTFLSLVQAIRPLVQSVQIKGIKTLQEYKSFDDLMSDSRSDVVLAELVQFVLGGYQLEKKPKP